MEGKQADEVPVMKKTNEIGAYHYVHISGRSVGSRCEDEEVIRTLAG